MRWSSQGVALQLFVNRLASRSVLTAKEESAILNLTGQVKQIAVHLDLVRLGQQVDHSCLVAEGLVGRFGQNKDGARQLTCLNIPDDMADLPSVIKPATGDFDDAFMLLDGPSPRIAQAAWPTIGALRRTAASGLSLQSGPSAFQGTVPSSGAAGGSGI